MGQARKRQALNKQKRTAQGLAAQAATDAGGAQAPAAPKLAKIKKKSSKRLPNSRWAHAQLCTPRQRGERLLVRRGAQRAAPHKHLTIARTTATSLTAAAAAAARAGSRRRGGRSTVRPRRSIWTG